MIKPNEIREIMTRSNQYLQENPDKMQVFIDAGHIACRGANSLSYEYQYTLNYEPISLNCLKIRTRRKTLSALILSF